jgi:hypothetical protein
MAGIRTRTVRLTSAALVFLGATIAHSMVSGAQVAVVTITPDPIVFDTTQVGGRGETVAELQNQTDATVTFTVTSTANEVTTIVDGCSGTLDPHASCEVTLAFDPVTPGTLSAQLVVRSTGDIEFTAGADIFGEASAATSTSPPVTNTEPPGNTTVAPTQPGNTTTAPSPTTPTTVPSPDDRTRLRDCEERARRATVAFPKSLEMVVGDASEVRVVASTGSTGATTSTLPVPTTVVNVALRCEVEAQLRGPELRVDPDGFQPGSFLDSPTIVWSWDVTPTQVGRRRLTLRIRSIAVIEGRRIEGAGTPLYQTDIVAKARPRSFWERVNDAASGVVEHPLVRGFGSLLVVGGAIAGGWRWLVKRREKTRAKDTPAAG